MLYVLLPHRMVDRFMRVRSHIFSCALTSLSLPRFSTVYRHVRDLLIQFEVPVDYRGTGINDSPWYILVFR